MRANVHLTTLLEQTAPHHHEAAVALLQDLIRVDSVNPYFSNYEPPSAKAISRTSGADSRMVGMSIHTDMGLLVNAGIPTVNFGLGAPSVGRQPDEHVAERDLHWATVALALAIAEWCGWDAEG